MSNELIKLESKLFKVRDDGLGISVAHGASFDEWKHVGAQLAVLDKFSAWAIGDWVNFGADKYGDQSARALEAEKLFQYKADTCRCYALICKLVAIRIASLSIAHHSVVYGLDAKLQVELLAAANTYQWTVSHLRAKVRALQATTPKESTKPIRTFIGWATEGIRLIRQSLAGDLTRDQLVMMEHELEPVMQELAAIRERLASLA